LLGKLLWFIKKELDKPIEPTLFDWTEEEKEEAWQKYWTKYGK
jgi:hypothetical protein